MSFCSNCGAQLPEGAKFCASCGTLVSLMQPQAAEQAQPVFNQSAEPTQPVCNQPAEQTQSAYNAFDEKSQPVFSQPADQQTPPQSPFTQYDYQQQTQGYYAPPVTNSPARPDMNISFLDAISEFFKRYVDFSGRSTKRAYWFVILFNIIVTSAIGILGRIPGLETLGSVADSLYALACLIPGIALSVRRMHDTGRSGTSVLINLLPIVGWIIFIVWCCGDSEGDNEWGYAPEFKNPQ